MDYKKLIIGSVIERNNKVIIGASFYEESTINWSREKSPKEIEELYTNKTMIIIGDNFNIKCKILSTSVANSISDYKSIFFETDLTNSQNRIKENDLIDIF